MTQQGQRAQVASTSATEREAPAGSRGRPPRPKVPVATDRVLFSALTPLDVADAVVRRLRAAIGLGLLSDGSQLPKEADLAHQLGVSNFALREALGRLRGEGLIVTRPGKHGGSFVTIGPEITNLAREQLRAMSTTELRDVGDWRRMLAGSAASLAAERATESSIARLHAFADAMGRAVADTEARQAYGRFHVEMAAAAQSGRMSRAEFSLHEEFDWLLTISLSDPDHRRQTAGELREIVGAINRREPDNARDAAERHAQATTDSLVMIRLNSIASVVAPSGLDPRPAGLARELQRIVALVMAPLSTIGKAAVGSYRIATDEKDGRGLLSQVIMTELLNIDFPVDGIGFIAEPEPLPSKAYWMNWWRRDRDGVHADRSHQMDPARDDFYDYTARDYFRYPRLELQSWAEGPYFDSGGADDYLLTVAVPVSADGRFIGVAAADLLIADLENHLAAWLVESPSPRMVINADRRVIVSNSATHIVGDQVPTDIAFALHEVGALGWAILSG